MKNKLVIIIILFVIILTGDYKYINKERNKYFDVKTNIDMTENLIKKIKINYEDIITKENNEKEKEIEIINTINYTKNSKSNNEEIINVKNYGLKGDGSNETEKLQKILREYKGKTLYFPSGKYYTNEMLTLYSNTTIIGENDTYFKNTNYYYNNSTGRYVTKPVFLNGEQKNNSYSSGYNGEGNITIQNVKFLESRVISLHHGYNININNITVINQPGGHAIEIAGSKNVIIRDSLFEGYGKDIADNRDYVEIIQIDRSSKDAFPQFGVWDETPVNGVLIENCIFKGSDKKGYNRLNVGIGSHSYASPNLFKNIVIRNNKFYNFDYSAISFKLGENITLENSYFEDCNYMFKYDGKSADGRNVNTKNINIENNISNNLINGIYINIPSNNKLETLNIINNKINVQKNDINIKGNIINKNIK